MPGTEGEGETLYNTEMCCPACAAPLYIQERDALLLLTTHNTHPLVMLLCVCGQLTPLRWDWQRRAPHRH
jgi:hypothetical protein